MAYLSILQVASTGRTVRDRVVLRVSQLSAHPARLAREIGLTLHRGRGSLTHGASATEGPLASDAAGARLEQLLSLEASRKAPLTHPDDGVSVLTIVALGPARLTAPVPAGDEAALTTALQALGAATDAAVDRIAVHVAPDAGQAFDPSAVTEGYPHLAAFRTSPSAGQQVHCRFCGAAFEAHRTSCPTCGGAAER